MVDIGYTNYLRENVIAYDGGAFYGNTNINITNNPVIRGDIYRFRLWL